MKRVIVYIFFMIFFIGCGCGGGGGNSTSLNFPSDNVGGTSYNSWDYITPNTNPNSTSIESRDIQGDSYSATFRSISPNTKVETPANSNGESVEYQNLSDAINITFKKDNNIVYSYKMKKNIRIGDTTTVEDSSCQLVNHFDTYSVGQTTYQDVIEIDCGKHRGFYAKGKGEIFKD